MIERCTATIKSTVGCVKSHLPSRKGTDFEKFVEQHSEEFDFFVRYYPVFVRLVESVSEREIDVLNTERPCKFRSKGNDPFRLKCALCIEGESEKRIVQCEECKFRE